jgi:tetratricopeptide (TPR) repeat protein
VKCIRSQLPRSNQYYSYDPPDYENPEPEGNDKKEKPGRISSAALESLIELKNEGNRLFAEKEYSKAIEVYGSAISLIRHEEEGQHGHDGEPSDERGAKEAAKVLGNRAESLLLLGRFADALADCSSALRYDPSFAKALYRRARAHWGLAERGGPGSYGAAHLARQALEEALALDRQSEAARGLLRAVWARCEAEYVLKQLEVVIEDEDLDGEGDGEEEEHVSRLMRDYEARLAAGGDAAPAGEEGRGAGAERDEGEEQLVRSRANVDPCYLKFKLRTDPNKSQCIRSRTRPARSDARPTDAVARLGRRPTPLRAARSTACLGRSTAGQGRRSTRQAIDKAGGRTATAPARAARRRSARQAVRLGLR